MKGIQQTHVQVKINMFPFLGLKAYNIRNKDMGNRSIKSNSPSPMLITKNQEVIAKLIIKVFKSTTSLDLLDLKT